MFADINLPVGRMVQQLVFLGRFLTIKSIPDSNGQSWSYWMFDPDIEYEDVYTEKCKLCAKLGVSFAERTQARLAQHMKRR